jgi:hypothetical protein
MYEARCKLRFTYYISAVSQKAKKAVTLFLVFVYGLNVVAGTEPACLFSASAFSLGRPGQVWLE